MDEIKKKFLQACINHGTLEIKNAKMILDCLCRAYDNEECNSEDDLKKIINEIDDEIRQFEQTLSIVDYPLNNVQYVVFGLLLANKGCKFQPQYTDTERKYFHELLETLISNESFCIQWDDLYKISDTLPYNAQHLLTKQRVQDLRVLWMSQGYLLENANKVYLGPRTLVEYSDYFKNSFPEFVNDCALCRKVVYWNTKCSDCNVKLHRNCIRKYLSKNSTCPCCKNTWNSPLTNQFI